MIDKIDTMKGLTRTPYTLQNGMQYSIDRIFFTISLFIITFSSQAQYSQPDVYFSTVGGCMNDSINFNPEILGLDTILVGDSLTQAIWNYGDGTVDTVELFPTAVTVYTAHHIYSSSGVFYPSLRVINRGQLDSTFTKRIVISPRANATTTNPYYEDFNTGPNGWYQEMSEVSVNSTTTDSLWEWGTAIGTTINTSASNDKVWGTRTTNLSTNYLQGESGWVYSPCFDLSQLDRPMVSIDVWRDMLTNIDGTVLEYYNEDNNTWNVLGEAYNHGINWYQDSFILSRPGAQANVVYPVGWTGESTQKESARYALDHLDDDLRNQTNVRFRVAFASSSQTIITDKEGFAFDNFFIGNRSQNILVEHFSGVGYPGIEQIESDLYQKLNQYPYNEGVSLIQYHTNVYSNDLFYQYNQSGSNSRSYFYGVGAANKARVNGKQRSNYTNDLSLELLSQDLLKDPEFEIGFASMPFIYASTNTLNATVVVEALKDMPLDQYIVYVVVTEDSLITPTGHITKSVFRNFANNNNGQVYQQLWSAGDNYTHTVNLQLNSILNLNHLSITTFIQSSTTREIFQVTNQPLYTSNILPAHLGVIRGTVALDTNNNCLKDSLEIGLYGKIVEIENNGNTYTTSADSIGQFYTIVDTGTCVLSITNLSPYRTLCTPSPVGYVSSGGTDTVDLLVKDSIFCPYLIVDISAPFLRATGGGSNYTVQYCNRGTVSAINAFVEVEIDPNLMVQGANIPYTNIGGSTYRFNIGNLVVGECGAFTISVLVPSALPIGQTLCTEAHIFPNTICIPNLWSGAVVNTSGTCVGDSIHFSIQNTGAAMGTYQNYYVVEDNIMMRVDSFLLGSGQIQDVHISVDLGHTYRIIAEQENGYPPILGDATTTTAIEACLPFSNGSFNTGFVTQFSNGNSAPFVAVDCQETIAAYDPNDKVGYPIGFGMAHEIDQNIALDYKIRFQNTGTDTAFNIVVIDTISTHLDLSSLEMGTSSHAYTWKLNGRQLTMQFDDILLVDSNANEPLSHGFIRYRINQNINNPIGTTINNQAAIYFDFNPPIFTNITEHTVGENIAILDVSIDRTLDESIEIKIYPNPFEEMTTIEVEGKTYKNLELQIFDGLGRLVETVTTENQNRMQLKRGRMQQGIYFYQLKGNNELISTGKIVAQ